MILHSTRRSFDAVTLQACINGQRHPDEATALPATPEAIVAEAVAAVQAGADSIHLHPKGPDGRDTLAADAVRELVEGIRARVTVPVGVTTGAWIDPDAISRVRAIDSWTLLPDFASVNWHEDGAEHIAQLLAEKRIGVEAGLYHLAAAEAWARSSHASTCLRAMIELPAELPVHDITSYAAELVHLVTATHPRVPILLHGEDDNCWSAFDHAVDNGYQTRIGLEDTLFLPDHRPASGNAALVRQAVTRMSSAGPA